MRDTSLLKPGTLSTSNRLRREVAYAISQVEIAKANGATGEGAQLSTFLHDAANKTPNATAGVPPTGTANVANGTPVNVENSVGDLDSQATATVTGNALTNVRLAATKTILTSGTKINAVSVTGTGNFATPTIANGVITAIVLSAS